MDPSRRWHEPGPPPLSARHSRELTNVGAAPMAIVGGFDVHRAQITFDALDTETGEVHRGRIPANRESVRGWVGRFAGERVEWRRCAVRGGGGCWGGAGGG